MSICETTGGWDCVFPFTYKVFPHIHFVFFKAKLCLSLFNRQGKIYNGCTTDNSSDGRAWCSTQTDEEGNHVDKKWGYCREHCGAWTGKSLLLLYFIFSNFRWIVIRTRLTSGILGPCRRKQQL